jgi:hypothetical protein
MVACTQFWDANGRYPTPRELAGVLPPVIDRDSLNRFSERPMRTESAKRLMERLTAAGYLTPRELAGVLPPVIDRDSLNRFSERPMRTESAKRLMERLTAAGYLTPQSAPMLSVLRDCDELLRTIHTTNGDRERIVALRDRIAAVMGKET